MWDAAAARTRGRSASDCSVPEQHQLRRNRERQADVHVAAADERRRLGLLEDDARDAEQDGHHRDADAKAGGKHGASNGMRGERSQREPADHRDALAFDLAVAHGQDACGAVGERRVVRDDDERRAGLVDPIEQRGDLRASGFIQLAGRLVGEQQARAVGSARAIATRCISPPDSCEGR